jgi:hypothetical protein
MSVFVDRRLAVTDRQRQREVLAKAGIISHCISCVREDWEVHAEPVGDSRAGLIVYTVKGKALASGMARLDQKGNLLFSLATLYRGITNAGKLEYTVEGTYNNKGEWSVKGTATASDPRV